MWVQIGQELPVEDDKGNRLENDKQGVPRKIELVPYEPFEDYEFEIDDMAKASDRRFFEATFEQLARPKGLSTVGAIDWDNAWAMISEKYITGVKHVKSGAVLTGNELKAFFTEDFDLDDIYAVLFTLKNQLNLSKSKKKNSKQRFGLPTE